MGEIVKFIEDNSSIIAVVISIISLLISLLQVVSDRINRRERFELQIDNIQQFLINGKRSLLMSITIINHSMSPLYITRIYYCGNFSQYMCGLKKTWCGEHYYPKFPETDIPRTERVFSSTFPVCVESNGAKSELIEFKIPKEERSIQKGDIVKLWVITNKGKNRLSTACLDDKDDLTYL